MMYVDFESSLTKPTVKESGMGATRIVNVHEPWVGVLTLFRPGGSLGTPQRFLSITLRPFEVIL